MEDSVADKEGFTEEWNCEDSMMTDCDGCTMRVWSPGRRSDCSAVDYDLLKVRK